MYLLGLAIINGKNAPAKPSKLSSRLIPSGPSQHLEAGEAVGGNSAPYPPGIPMTNLPLHRKILTL